MTAKRRKDEVKDEKNLGESQETLWTVMAMKCTNFIRKIRTHVRHVNISSLGKIYRKILTN